MRSLEQAIKEDPLTPEKFVNFMNKIKVYFTHLGGSIGTCSNEKELILIDPWYGMEEAMITLVHEALHIFYKEEAWHTKLSDEEKLIERETQNFYKENMRFLHDFFVSNLYGQVAIYGFKLPNLPPVKIEGQMIFPFEFQAESL